MAEPAPTLPAAPLDQVAAINPDGKPVWIPKAQVSDALAQGYSLPPNPDETTANQLGGAAEALARGLVPGAPKLEAALLPSAGSEEEQRKRAALFPTTEKIAQAAGAGLQMAGTAALTAGAGAAAEAPEAAEALEAATEGAEALPAAQAGEAVAAGAEPAEAAEAAGATPGAAQGAITEAVAGGPVDAATAGDVATRPLQSGYVQQAIAGGVSGGTDTINEDELGDHQFNAEALLQNVGLGGLLGLAGEGAVNALRDTVAPAVFEKAGAALDALKKAGGEAFTRTLEAINPEMKGLVKPAMEAIQGGATKMTDAAAEQLGTTADQAMGAMDDASRAHWNDFEATEAERNLADRSRADVLGAGEPQSYGAADALPGAPSRPRQIEGGLLGLQQKIGDALEAIPGQGGAVGEVKGAFRDFQKVISDPEASAADLHAATREFKQAVGQSGMYKILRNPMLEGSPQWDSMKALEQRVWVPLKQAMSDESIWGAEQAGRNAAVDAAIAKYINAEKQVLKDFGASELDLANGKREAFLKASRVRDAMNGDPLRNQERLQHFQDWEQAARGYLDELKRTAANAGAVSPGGKDLEALLESVTAQRQAAQAYEPVAALLRASRQTAPMGLGAAGAAPLTGFALHAAGAGAPIIAPAVAGVAALRAPVRAMQMYAKISGAAATAKEIISSGVRRFLSSEPARAASQGFVASALRGRTIRDAAGLGSNTFDRQAKNIGTLAANQEGQVQALTRNTSRLQDVAPKTTLAVHRAATAALQELFQNLPRNPAPSILQSENEKWEPPPDQLHTWNALHAAILKPQTFLDACAAGTATPQVWASLQRVYPQWTGQVRQATVDYLGSHPDLRLTPAQKLCTSMIVGAPISPTVAPDQVAFQQSLFVQNAAQAPAGGAPKKLPQHGLDKLDLADRSAIGGRRSVRR